MNCFLSSRHTSFTYLGGWSIQGILKGKYHCTVDLLFDWFGINCVTTDNFCFYSQNRLIKTVKQEVNGTVILPPLVFPGQSEFVKWELCSDHFPGQLHLPRGLSMGVTVWLDGTWLTPIFKVII